MVLAWEFVEEYVNHVPLPLLVKINHHLNPQVSVDAKIGVNEVVDFLFDAPVTIGEASILGLLCESCLCSTRGWQFLERRR